MRSSIAIGTFLASFLAGASALHAATCTPKDFSDAVDQSGASLRTLTLDAQPKLQARLARYKELNKLSDTDYENTALDAIQDDRLTEYDKQSSALLLTVDSLGRAPEGAVVDCAKLNDLKAAASELNVVIKAKSDYMLQRLDQKIAEAEHNNPAAKPAEKPTEKPAEKLADKPAEKPAAPAPVKQQQTAARATPAPSKPVPAPPVPMVKPAAPPSAASEWAASTKSAKSAGGPEVAMREPLPPADLPPPEQEGYSIEEIRDATRGFFGTISTNLATVIEHSFKQLGRPTAYVLGTEGGGAFLAGLRFGEGMLYMRAHSGLRKVYWHGPSVGTDFGASGSRTLFLIYRLQDETALYRNFTGIDGSAYFVGGVGVTVLKGGDIIMAPIRSGVGMRLGANLGYLRFTEKPTWNPF